jgi:hypothetical protein
MIRPVASTLTALMLTGFMVRDRAWTDPGTVTITAILWGLSAWLWVRWRNAGDKPGGSV